MDRLSLSKQIGSNIRKFRLENDFSQENLALTSGVHPAYISKLERGEKCPTIDTLYKISKALNISIYELINIEDLSANSSIAILRIEKAFENISVDKQNQIADIIAFIIKTLD